MHFSVAFTVTTIFYSLSRRFPMLLGWGGVPAGLLYGAGVYFAMFRGVLPLMIELRSLYLTGFVRPPPPALGWPQFIIHLVCVGLPIALVACRFAPVTATGADRSGRCGQVIRPARELTVPGRGVTNASDEPLRRLFLLRLF